MKILHLINTLSAGGAELHLFTLCRHLKRCGVEGVVACLREQVKDSRALGADFEQEGIRVVRLQADSRYDVRVLGGVTRLLKKEQPDVLHTHLPRADFAGAIGRVLLPSVPWVCSVHDIYSESWSGKWTLSLFNRIWRRAEALIATSHAVQSWLVQERHMPAEKVTVIYYGIEPQRFGQPHPHWRSPASLDGQAVVGAIGRLEPRKGHETLIRAMPEILQRVPKVSLLIAGHDPWGYSHTLRSVMADLKLDSEVRLVGFQDDVPSFLQALDVFALASRSEGFGQVVIEAMAAGKPVVASRIAALTEIVVDGETGLLVEPENPKAFAEAIAWLLTHFEEARRMGRRGREHILRHFSAERMSAQTMSLYSKVIRAGN
jgi:glycosyltransferase involved in cell wall biosynthesis